MQKTLSKPPKKLGQKAGHQTNEKARCWLLTLHFAKESQPDNLTKEDKVNFSSFRAGGQVNPCVFCIYQCERCPDTGRLHIQAYVEFERALSLPGVKKHFSLPQLHCEIRLGTQQQAIAYCSKEDTRVSKTIRYGKPIPGLETKPKVQGLRADWQQVWDQLKTGETIVQVLDERPYMLNNISAIAKGQWEALKERKRTSKTQFIVLSGDARVGKTWTALHMAKNYGDYYLMPNDGKAMWWNGYDPIKHDTVVLDEFTGSKMPLTFLNQLTDKYDLRVQTKGGFLPFLAKRVIVTSNFLPHQWYDFANKEKNLCFEALEGRIDVHVEFRKVFIQKNDPNQQAQTNEFVPRLRLIEHKGSLHWSQIRTPLALEHTPVSTPEPSSEERADIIAVSKKKRKNDCPPAPIPKRSRPELYCEEVLDDSDEDSGAVVFPAPGAPPSDESSDSSPEDSSSGSEIWI